MNGSHFCDTLLFIRRACWPKAICSLGSLGKCIVNDENWRKTHENLTRINQNSNLEAIKCSFGQTIGFREPQNRFWNPKIGFGSPSGAQKNQQGLVLEVLNRVWAAPWSFLGGSWALLGKSIEKRPRVITKMCCFGIPKSRPKSIKIDAKKHRVFKHVFFTRFC